MNYTKFVKAIKVLLGFIFIFYLIKCTLDFFKDFIDDEYHFLIIFSKKILFLSAIVAYIKIEKIKTKRYFKNNLYYLVLILFLLGLSFYNTHYLILEKNYNTTTRNHIFYLLENLFVGTNEEGLFRVILFLLVFNSFSKNTKTTLFKSILIASFFFGAIHFFNINVYKNYDSVLIQVVLAFGLGIIFQIILIRSNNLLLVVYLHAIFDYYGMRKSKLFKIIPQDNSGFTTTEVIVNISVFVLIALFLTFLCYRFCKKQYQRAEVFREQEVIST